MEGGSPVGQLVQLAEFRSTRGRIEPLQTKSEIAEHFRVSERTIERWMDRGLPYRKPYEGGSVRFSLAECDAWARRREAAS